MAQRGRKALFLNPWTQENSWGITRTGHLYPFILIMDGHLILGACLVQINRIVALLYFAVYLNIFKIKKKKNLFSKSMMGWEKERPTSGGCHTSESSPARRRTLSIQWGSRNVRTEQHGAWKMGHGPTQRAKQDKGGLRRHHSAGHTLNSGEDRQRQVHLKNQTVTGSGRHMTYQPPTQDFFCRISVLRLEASGNRIEDTRKNTKSKE